MNPILTAALRAGSLSSLGCVRETREDSIREFADGADGCRMFDFGGGTLEAWNRLGGDAQNELVRNILDYCDLGQEDENELRDVLAQLMIP